MRTEERLKIAMENMDTLSDRLRELSNLMDTVYLGLTEESAEQQVLDCIMCFLHSVNELLKLAKQTSAELCTEK